MASGDIRKIHYTWHNVLADVTWLPYLKWKDSFLDLLDVSDLCYSRDVSMSLCKIGFQVKLLDSSIMSVEYSAKMATN